MSGLRTGEIPFPEQKGTLMVCKTFVRNPEYGITRWVLQSEELLAVTEIGKPKNPWHFQNIARIVHDGDLSRGEPDFGSSRGFVTSAVGEKVKVDYTPASSEDLKRFLSSLDQHYQEDLNWKDGLCDFLSKIESLTEISPGEKKRIEEAFSKVRAKK